MANLSNLSADTHQCTPEQGDPTLQRDIVLKDDDGLLFCNPHYTYIQFDLHEEIAGH